ncbi:MULTISPECIES: hypothetical protein [Ramlibacter]|uniref:hypothetical protein n=1 Tax=Ramlibacter TaxID=174951 RepID=UPI001D10FFAE|nr:MULTISPECIES: hypothetical protein [Ramlibacter]
MGAWTAFAERGRFPFDPLRTATLWPRLHAGDAEPMPQDPAVLQAWALFHAGEFEAAARAGLAAGSAGITAANKATAIYANYLEPHEPQRLALFMEVAARSRQLAQLEPRNANAWYWQAYALGRYSQGISVAKALAQGLGTRVKESLERAIALQPLHADAQVALGAFHAEVIDKVGALIGGMTHGAKKETGLRLFQEALRIHPASIIGRIEYANGLLMLEGDACLAQATRLYQEAALAQPLDAMEQLNVDLALSELEDVPDVAGDS